MTNYFSHDAEHPDYIRMPGPAQELMHVLALALVTIVALALLTAHDQPPLSHQQDEPLRDFASGAPSPELSAAVSSIGNHPVVFAPGSGQLTFIDSTPGLVTEVSTPRR